MACILESAWMTHLHWRHSKRRCPRLRPTSVTHAHSDTHVCTYAEANIRTYTNADAELQRRNFGSQTTRYLCSRTTVNPRAR